MAIVSAGGGIANLPQVHGDGFVGADILNVPEREKESVSAWLANSSYFDSPPMALMGGPPCWTWVMMLAAPPAADMTYVKD